MKPLQRACISDRVVEYLKEEIRNGTMRREVPACRRLAEQLEVSPPTVLQAFAKLVAEGWLVAGGEKRPYQIVSGRRTRIKARHRLLLISPQPLHSLNSYTRTGVDRLILECTSRDWEIQTRILDYRNTRQPSRKWDELIRSHNPTHLVAVIGTPVVGRWAKRLAIPTLFLGGSPGDTGITTVGVSLSASLRILLRALTDGECQHFSLPICGYPEEFTSAIHAVCREELDSRGMVFVPDYHAPSCAGDGPDEVRSVLKPVFQRRTPRLLVFTRITEYLAVLGVIQDLAKRRENPPKLAFLAHEEPLMWLSPAPASFVYPYDKLWQLVMQWLNNPDSQGFNRGYILLDPIFQGWRDAEAGDPVH